MTIPHWVIVAAPSMLAVMSSTGVSRVRVGFGVWVTGTVVFCLTEVASIVVAELSAACLEVMRGELKNLVTMP